MKTLQKLTVIAIILLTSNPIWAQRKRADLSVKKQEIQIAHQVETYAEALQLDDLQKVLLKTNLTEYSQKQREIFRGDGTREEKMAAAKELRSQQKEELAQFLDEEQMTTLKELRKKERGKRRRIRPNSRKPQ